MGITAIADDKIEGTEVLTQQLTLTSPTQDELDNAGNIFFQTASTITIIDVTGNCKPVYTSTITIIDVTGNCKHVYTSTITIIDVTGNCKHVYTCICCTSFCMFFDTVIYRGPHADHK